jgi:aspartate/methionine/tyrosine aminotransferase
VQLALPHLLDRGGVVREQIQTRTRRNLASLRRLAAESAAVTVLGTDGGWCAVIQVPRYRSEESLVLELLTAERVLVHPGYFYDFEHEAFLIVSLLVEPALFDDAISRVLARATSRGAFA